MRLTPTDHFLFSLIRLCIILLVSSMKLHLDRKYTCLYWLPSESILVLVIVLLVVAY